MFSSSYSPSVPPNLPLRWTIKTTPEVRSWLRSLRQTEPNTYRSVNVAIDMLAEIGPGLGRPLVDTVAGSDIKNLKELRPRSGRDVAIRILFAFDPWSQAVLPVAGNKAGDRSGWYRAAIPAAETAYGGWLAVERKRRESQ